MAAPQIEREQQKEKKQSVKLDHPEDVSKQGSPSESQVNSEAIGNASRFHNRSPVADQTVSSYPTTASYSYYYPGYNGSVGDFYNQGYYVAGNAMDSQYPVAQTDGGSILYMMPGVYSGYDPYTSFVPVSTIGVDAQFVGQQVYPPSPVFQSPIPSLEYSVTSLPQGDIVSAPYHWGSSLLVGDGAFGNGYVGVLGIPPSKPNSSAPIGSTVPPPKSSKLSESTNLAFDVLSGNNKKLKPFNKASSHVSSFQSDLPAQGYYSVAKFPFHNQGKGGLLYSNNLVNSRPNVKGWGGPEKLKTRNKVSSSDDAKVVNDNSQSPPITINENGTLGSGGNVVESLGDDRVGSSVSIISPVRRDQYNLTEFSIKYDRALFFVIKSYSEDDIHKSIKYNVWASTPNGNKRLSSAYQDAQEKTAETGSKCPVFLYFSVNASGQFCGVAEMIGQVDFNKSMDFWQQSKWNGYFPVKWHIIKDIPNAQLRHIILQNNENKPVTNSRDTQEVKFHQGIEMLSIFKNYTSATSILDDFDFYENRQKIMQEKRLRQSVNHHDLQLKVEELASGIQTVDLST